MKISKMKRLIALGLAITMIASIMPMNLFGISKVFADGVNLTSKTTDNEAKINDITWTIGSDTESGVFYTLKGKDGINYISSLETGFSIPENVSFNSIKSVGVDLSFSIVNYDVRNISHGDYLEFVAPEGMEFASAPAEIKTAVGNYVIGTFSLENNNKALRLTFGNAVDPSNYITDIAGGVTLEMQVSDVTKFGEAHNVVLLDGVGNNTTKVELAFPAATSDIKGVTKTGAENTDINGASWKVSVGTDPQSAGASLAGVKVIDTFDAQDMYAVKNDTSVPVVIEGTKADGTATSIHDTFEITTDEASHTTSLTYTFPADIVAPATLKYDTKYTNRLLKEATLNKGTKYTVANTATISGETVTTTDPALLTASATADVTVTTVQKSAKQIDANTMEWTLILNEKNNNVWAAVVNDTLMPGLTVDEAYGIHITDLTTTEENTSDKSVVLKASGDTGAKTIASDTVNVSYTDDLNAENKQELKISFKNTFNHKYAIVFRTKVAANFVNTGNGKDDDGKDSSADGKNTNVIDNTATVSVSYPTGDGGTDGEAVVYEDTTVKAVFVSAYITETPEGAHTDTGLLDWSVTPSCKTGFDTAKITLDPENALAGGAQELVGTPEVTYKKDDGTYAAVDSSCYGVENNRIFTFDALALKEKGIDFNKVRINYTTKAIDFFKSTSEITYNQAASIEVRANIEGDDMTYTYTSKTVSQKLQNKLIEKTVESVFDDVNNEAYFHFTIPVNKNGIQLTNMELTDDLSSSFYYKVDNGDGIAVNSSWYKLAPAAVPTESKKYVTHMVVGSTETTNGISIDEDANKITYSNPSLNQAGVLHIYVQMTDVGKDALGLAQTEIAKNNNDVKIYVNNTATIKANELLTDDHTMSATVESKFDNNSTVVEYKNVDKKGVQGTGAKAPNVTWTININAAFANEHENQVITDKIPAGLTIDRKSIKLSYGKHGENGTEIVAGQEITATDSTTDSTKNEYAYSIASHRDGTTTLKVILPKGDIDESYVLTYDTVINKSAVASYSNTLEYAVDGKTCEAKATINAKKFVWGTGYPKVLFTFTKLDKLSTATNKIPVAGAHYGLYSSKDCKPTDLVTEGYTDGLGQITLVADQLDSNGNEATYYLKEMASETGTAIEGSNDISGYIVDNKVYGGYTATTPGPKSIVPVIDNVATGDSYFTDVRKEDATGTANLDKLYKYDAHGISVAGLQSEFNLIIYPKAELGNTTYTQKVIVEETEAGKYDFVGTGDATAADTDTTNVLKNTLSIQADGTSDGIGTIKVNKLPWGTYAFVETSAPDGFVTNNTPVKFRVNTDGSVKYLDADNNVIKDNIDPTADATAGELVNNQTKVSLKKTDATGNLLTDYSNVKFIITGPDSDAHPFLGTTYGNETSIIIDRASIDASTGILGKYAGVFKAGVTYTVKESDDILPYGYAAVKPFTFTINENTGAVTVSTGAPAAVSKAETSDTINTLVTIKEPVVSLMLNKKDQNGDAVVGADLQIEDVTEGASVKGFVSVDTNNIPTGTVSNKPLTWKSVASDWNLTGQLIAGHTYKITETKALTGYFPANELDSNNDSKYYVTVQVGKDGAIKATASGNTSDSDKQAVLTSSYDAAKKILTLKNLKIQANVKLNKVSSIVDKTSNKNITLTGVEYDVYSVTDDGAGNKKETIYKEDVATAAGGVLALSNVPEGKYYAKEKTALKNYKRDDNKYSFEVKASNVNKETGASDTIIVKDGDKEYLTNEPQPVSVTVNDEGLGATYVLYGADPATNPNQSPIAEKTLAQGKTSLTFDNLGWNTNYYVVQKSIPDGYILDKAKKVTTFNRNDVENVDENELVQTVSFVNNPVTLKIAKNNQFGELVKGANLVITDAADSSKTFTWTSDGSQWDLTGQLVTGHTYKITETNALPGYVAANAKDADGNAKYYVTVEVADDGTITATDAGNTSGNKTQSVLTSDLKNGVLTITNLQIKSDAKIEKVSSLDNNVKLSGVTFDLYQKTGTTPDTKLDTKITAADGKITFTGLYAGNYYVVETTTVNNYVLDSNPIEFTVDASSMNHETGLMNPVIISNEKSGKYVTNAPKKVSIAITDKCMSDNGQTNDNIFGAKYELYDVNPSTDGARLKQTIIIDRDTNKFTGLDWNKTYYIKQVSVPDGYILDTLVKEVNYSIDVSMITNSSTSLVKTVDCVNTQTNVNFTKIDQEGNAVKGATFTITPATEADRFADGETSKTWTSDGKAYNLKGQLVAGCSYVITENFTPAEYLDAKDSHGKRASKKITVTADGKVTVANGDDNSANMTASSLDTNKTVTGCSMAYSSSVTMVNTKIYSIAQLTKVDSLNHNIKLKDAKFNLYRMTGATPDTANDTLLVKGDFDTDNTVEADVNGHNSLIVTDSQGQIKVSHLPYGAYYFKEVEAPISYHIVAGDNIYRFDVNAANHGQNFTNANAITNKLMVENEREPGQIIVSKSGFGTTVAGAKYGLYKKLADNKYEAVKARGADGKYTNDNYVITISDDDVTRDDDTGKYTGTIAFKNLDWGQYYVKEISAPAGYTLDNNYHGIYEIKDGLPKEAGYKDASTEAKYLTIKDVNLSDEVTSVNIHVQGIKSVDEDDNKTTEELDNVEIHISGPLNEVDNGKRISVDEKTFTTDADGYVKAKNEFIVGNIYQVSAVDPHDNYNIIDSYSFKVLEDGSVELIEGYAQTKISKPGINEILMQARKSLFYLELTDVENKALADGKLAIYKVDQDGNVIDENGNASDKPVNNVTYTTEVENGKAVKVKVEGLMPGDYQLKQKEAPSGYVTADPINFTLNENNTIVIKTEDDTQVLGTENSINPKKVATILMQDMKTQISIQTLCKPYEKIQKTYGQYQEPLDAVKVRIYEDPACQIPVVYDDSVMELPKASADETEDNADGTVTLVSEEIADKDDSVKANVIDGEARVYIQGLKAGKTYYVQLDSVDDAHNVILNNMVYAVKVENDPTKTTWAKLTDEGLSEFTTSPELTIVSDVYRGDVVLTKTDRDDSAKTLAGSVYGIYRKNDTNMSEYIGRSTPTIIKMTNNTNKSFNKAAAADRWELVSQITTDANGQISFDGLVAGVEYQIKEIDEPEGYQVSKDPITFKLEKTTNAAGEVTGTKVVTISNGNKTAAINEDGSIIWFEPRLKVEINKLDPSGNRLAGATLQVIHKSTGKVIDEWVSEDTQGHVISGVLKGGDAYILREVSAPQGYVCADDITFVAEAKKLGAGENYVQQVTMVDYATKEDERIANANGTNDMATQQVVRVVAPKTNDTNIICEILHLFK